MFACKYQVRVHSRQSYQALSIQQVLYTGTIEIGPFSIQIT